MRIYLAGPLFTSAERMWNAKLTELLRAAGLEVFAPQEIEPKRTGQEMAVEIFHLDVAGIESCEVVVAITDQPDPDSGTCWEMGYAYKAGKPILAVRTDFRYSGGEQSVVPYNIMPYVSADGSLNLPFATVEGVAACIVKWFKDRGDL